MSKCENVLNLPLDCKAHICSFLSLHSCIFSFGILCSQTLVDILPDLTRRRNQFFQSLQNGISPTNSINNKSSHSKNCNSSTNVKHSSYPDHVFPSTPRERISCLHRSLPQMHPLRHIVYKLHLELSSENSSSLHNGQSEKKSTNTTFSKLESILVRINQTLYAHKLHSFLLSSAVTIFSDELISLFRFENLFSASPSKTAHSKPIICSRYDVSTTLDRYIGDVMVATMLLPHMDLIDGGILQHYHDKKLHNFNHPRQNNHSKTINTEIHWIRLTLTFLRLDPLSAEHWYRAWILIHSSLLRMMPMDADQSLRLGIKFA